MIPYRGRTPPTSDFSLINHTLETNVNVVTQ